MLKFPQKEKNIFEHTRVFQYLTFFKFITILSQAMSFYMQSRLKPAILANKL
jgi:hypothetical protein